VSDSSRMNAYYRKPTRLEYDPADREARRREYRGAPSFCIL